MKKAEALPLTSGRQEKQNNGDRPKGAVALLFRPKELDDLGLLRGFSGDGVRSDVLIRSLGHGKTIGGRRLGSVVLDWLKSVGLVDVAEHDYGRFFEARGARVDGQRGWKMTAEMRQRTAAKAQEMEKEMRS